MVPPPQDKIMIDDYERYVARVTAITSDGGICMNMWHSDEEWEPLGNRSLVVHVSPDAAVNVKGPVKCGDIVRVLAWEGACGSQLVIEPE